AGVAGASGWVPSGVVTQTFAVGWSAAGAAGAVTTTPVRASPATAAPTTSSRARRGRTGWRMGSTADLLVRTPLPETPGPVTRPLAQATAARSTGTARRAPVPSSPR